VLTDRGTSTRIPSERYISPEFAALEHERLWPRVWQIACTVDHVAEPGDWYEYRVGWYSVVIVRGADGMLRAFQNACRHRGNAICTGSGAGLTELRCPFHRWAWDLDGRLREIPSRSFFGPMADDELGLIPARVDVWARLVFVNLDTDAMPLDEYLEGVPADAAPAAPDEFRCSVTTTTAVACNWKVATDGFSETYHVQGIHREMLGSIDDIHASQHLWERHGVSYQDYGVPSPRLGPDVSPETVWRSFVVTQGGRMGPDHTDPDTPMPPLAAGESVRSAIVRRLRAEHARSHGTDCAAIDDDRMLRLAQYNLFPNATVLLWGEMINVLIARPGPTPDDAHLDTFLLYREPPGAPRSRPVDVPVPADADFGFVLNADFGILATAQRGLHQPGLTDLVVSGEEGRILNLHRNLERGLGIEPAVSP
jgi:phenylpropionate dioxygenase-like ring-hydroxylating dioxygenase large terminal subunit